MKVAKTFRLSEEAVAVLDAQDNATAYLESLLLGEAEVKVPWANLEYQIYELAELVREGVPSKEPVNNIPEKETPTEKPDPSFGYPCCLRVKPCKHWQWNSEISAYVNSITGNVREVSPF